MNGYDLELVNKFEGELLFNLQSRLSSRHSVQHLALAPEIWTKKPTTINLSRCEKRGHPHPVHYYKHLLNSGFVSG